MSVCYNKLWKLLIDKNVSKGELIERCLLPSGTMNKLRKNIPIHLKVLERICLELDCNIEDVVEVNKDLD